MNSLMRNGGLYPSLFDDFLRPSPFLGSSLFDVDFDMLPARVGFNVPSANITESEKNYLIELAAPGLTKKDFKVEMDNDVLTISAEKKEEKKEGDEGYSRKEYSYNSFSRSFTLPENCKSEKIDAKYEDGVLKLVLPKKEVTPVKAKKEIAVS